MSATRPGQSTYLLLDIVELLKAEQIDYAVIGALAAAVHGVVRASLDADAVVRVTIRQLSELQTKLAARGYLTDLRQGDIDDPIPAMLQVSDRHGNRVDLLAGLRGLEADAYVRAIDIPFAHSSLRVIGREDFIAMKAFAGGPLDMSDARYAIAVGRESLDVELLLRLAGLFGAKVRRACEQLLQQ